MTPLWFRFLDWPAEQGGTAKQATIDAWLYVFQVDDKAARLYEEVWLQPKNENQPELYFRVDLKREKGKGFRECAPLGEDSLWIDDDSRHVLSNVRYYVLCSPFQLHWSRIKDLATTRDPKAFEKMAREQRGLRCVHLDEKHTKPGPGNRIRIKSIWSPWAQAHAMNRQFQAKLSEWSARAETKERQQWRSLLASIDMMTRGRTFKGLLDEDERRTIYAVLLEDDQLFFKVEQAAKKLVDFLKGAPMTEMELDAAATNDVNHREAFAAIRELERTRIGRKYRQEWFEEHHNLVFFDAVPPGAKLARKVPRSIFTWAKSWADAAAGSPSFSRVGGALHETLLEYAQKQAYMFSGVYLEKAENFRWYEKASREKAKQVLTAKEFAEWEEYKDVVALVSPGEAKRRLTARELAEWERKCHPPWASKLDDIDHIPMMFTKKSVGELKNAVNANPRLNGIFTFVDAINVAFAIRALLEDEGSDKTKKAAAAVSGLCAFFTSGLGLARSVSVGFSGDELKQLRSLRNTSIEAHDMLTSYENQGLLRRGLARAGATKSITSGISAVGALADVVLYKEDLFQGLHEAKTGDSSDRIWMWPGLGLMGSFVSCAGYFLLMANPAGALLVGLGTLTSAFASAGAILWPGIIASDIEKWLMHSFVGKLHATDIAETETFTSGKALVDYHKKLDLQLAALDYILFEFTAACEVQADGGRPWLKIEVFFRQLKCRSKVRLQVFGKLNGKWGPVRRRSDWRPVGRTEEDDQTHLRKERAARYVEGVPAEGFDDMKITVQLDVLGDGSFLYPEEAREVPAKK
jgi:hypothetical protein